MNRQQATQCNSCQRANHISRFCPDQTCGTCNLRGHNARDCPLQHELRQFTLWFPVNADVRMGVNRLPMREFPGIGQNLQRMQNADAVTMNGSRFFVEFNSLRIKYGGQGSIVIAMQDDETDAETLITIRYVRQANVQLARVKIAAKYTVMSGQLIEDVDRLASGSQQQQSPSGDVHVLLYVRDMLAMTPVLEINDAKFYLEWNVRQVNGRYLRAEVCVSTAHAYANRLVNRDREMVENGWAYFRGVQAPDRRAAAGEIAEEIIIPNEAAGKENVSPAIVEQNAIEEENAGAAAITERAEMANIVQPEGEDQRENVANGGVERAAEAMDPEMEAFFEENFQIEIPQDEDLESDSSDTDSLQIVSDDEPQQIMD